MLIFTQSVNITNLSGFELVKYFMPFNFTSYWFIERYILLYLLTTFLNILIKNIDRKKHKQLTIILLLFESVLSALSIGLVNVTNGMTLYHFMIMYIIGAYINKYNIDKMFMEKININNKRLIYSLIIFFSAFINLATLYLGMKMTEINSSCLTTIGSFIMDKHTTSNNILIIISSISMLLLFSTFNIKSKLINIVGKSTLGIYMIHDSDMIRGPLYVFLKINTGKIYTSYKFILYSLFISLIIFVTFFIIDRIRIFLFEIIGKMKIIKTSNNKIENFFISLFE